MSASESQQAAAAVAGDGWVELQRLFPADWKRHADDHGFNRVDDSEAGPDVACRLRMMLFLAAHSWPLRMTVAAFTAAGIADVSHVTLHNWFRSAPGFLSALLVALSDESGRFNPVRWAGYQVRAIDASCVQRPGAKGTTARVHYALRLNDMQMSQCLVTDDSVGESLRNFRTWKDILDVLDRGYSNPPSIAAATDQHGDVLVRLNPNSLPLYERGARNSAALNVRRLASLLRPSECREWFAEVRPKDHDPIDVRLIIVRLPEEKARIARERAREHARAEHGRDASPELVYLAGFVMLVSTVPVDRLTTEQLVELYRLRWQVELQFKREKSIGGLDQLPNFLAETIQSWILLKLIISELARRLVNAEPARSLDSHAHHLAENDSSSTADAPWECAALGLCFIKSMLLSLPIRAADVRAFVRKFLHHLATLKSPGTRRRRRQIDDFVARLAAVPA